MSNSGWRWSDIWEAAKTGNVTAHTPRHYSAGGARVPTDQEYEDWLNSTPENSRPSDIKEYLKSRNPYRWSRIHKDLKWLEKELSKLGMNPDDARWYL